MSISADFSALPDDFVGAYARELMAWARGVRRNPVLTIELQDRQAAMLRDAGLPPPKVNIVAEVYKHPVIEEMRIVVRPMTEMDGELIRKHAELLPRMARAKRVDMARLEHGVGWRFERVPDEFLTAYKVEILKWGRNFKGVGRSCPITLRRPHGKPVVYDDNGEEPMFMVQLFADHVERAGDRLQIVAMPETERDAALIADHSQDIARYGAPIPRRLQ